MFSVAGIYSEHWRLNPPDVFLYAWFYSLLWTSICTQAGAKCLCMITWVSAYQQRSTALLCKAEEGCWGSSTEPRRKGWRQQWGRGGRWSSEQPLPWPKLGSNTEMQINDRSFQNPIHRIVLWKWSIQDFSVMQVINKYKHAGFFLSFASGNKWVMSRTAAITAAPLSPLRAWTQDATFLKVTEIQLMKMIETLSVNSHTTPSVISLFCHRIVAILVLNKEPLSWVVSYVL